MRSLYTALLPVFLALPSPSAAAPAVAPGAVATSQAPLDLFAPHVRWSEAAPSSAPWLPRDVVFSEGGELVFGAGSVGTPTALAMSSSDMEDGHVFGSHAVDGALGTVRVASGLGSDALFVLSQHAVLGAANRVTRVQRLRIGAAGGLVQTWEVDVGAQGNGTSLIEVSRDGASLVVAVEVAGNVDVAWLDPATGAVVSSVAVAGGTLRELSIADDGSRLALLAGPVLWVLDGSGATVHQQSLTQVTNALSLSGDGASLAVGDATAVSLQTEVGGLWTEQTRIDASPGEVPVRVALSGDGGRVVIGYWNQVTGLSAHFQVRSASGALLHDYIQSPGTAGLQNYPEAVAITPDGRRAAYGSWGVGDTQPEALLIDVDSASVVVAADLAGSLRGMALSDCGTRLAVAAKHSHANAFTPTGQFTLLDSGEREVQVTARATTTGLLKLSSQRPGAVRALFVLGAPLTTPINFRGAGLLFLDRAQPMRVKGATPDASGRADVTLKVPALLQKLGPDFEVQAAWRMLGGMSLGETADPLIL